MQVVHAHGDVIAEKYQIIDILGQGGSSTTYAVQDLTSNQKIALKSLSLHWVKDWKVVELFEREGNILSQLDHPAIPRYLEYFYIDTPDNRSFYIAQEVAPGKSLAMMVEQGWRTSEQEVQDIAIQVLEVLKYLHGLTPPVVHRDIKPQNIIRGEDGKVFLVDFGAVQQTYHDTFMRGSTVVGTYGYMAPEQFRSQAVPASDLYGLGATILYLLTHRSPADLPSDGLKIDVRSCVHVSEHFATWLEKILEPDLEERFGSAADAMEVLVNNKQIVAQRNLAKKPQVKLKAVLAIVSIIIAICSMKLLGKYRLEILTKLSFNSFLNTIYLDKAITNNDYNLVYELINNNADIKQKKEYLKTSLLTTASVSKNQEFARYLIDNGADVNASDVDKNTPLHLFNYPEVSTSLIELLIAKGADVNAKNHFGKTPLHTVSKAKIAEILIKHGANVNAKTQKNITPLHFVDDAEIAKVLIKHGADVNAKDTYGLTPLLLLKRRKEYPHYKEIAEVLIDNGANVNVKDDLDNTPLHIFIYDDIEIVKKLLKAGADVNAKNKNGETPLHIAQKTYLGESIKNLLLKNGADPTIKDNRGLTPQESMEQERF